MGFPVDGLTAIDEAHSLAASIHPELGRQVDSNRSLAAWMAGRPRDGLRAIEAGLTVIGSAHASRWIWRGGLRVQSERAWLLSNRADALHRLGELEAARVALAEAEQGALAAGDAGSLVAALTYSSRLAEVLGETEQLRPIATRVAAPMESLASAGPWRVFARSNDRRALMHEGAWDAARESAEADLALERAGSRRAFQQIFLLLERARAELAGSNVK